MIDTSGTTAARVRRSAAIFAEVPQYVFVSSIAVYRDAWVDGAGPLDEGAPVERTSDYAREKIDAERALAPDRACVIRAGFLVGPHDPEDRLGWWEQRIAAGRPFIAPGSPERPLQVLDARALGRWIARLVTARAVGTFNAVGPATPWSSFLDALARGRQYDARFVAEDVLIARGITAMPLWVPGGAAVIDGARARAHGLLDLEARG